MASTLISRNLTIGGHRTSARLEPAMWDALGEICEREGTTVHQLCTVIDRRRVESSLTAALRVFLLSYYRAAATEDGHVFAGHGQGMSFLDRPAPTLHHNGDGAAVPTNLRRFGTR